MKNFCKCLNSRLEKVLIAMAGMLLSISAYGQLTPYTPEEVIFQIEEDEGFIQYILLDESATSDDAKFFVLNRNHFNRNRAFNTDPGQKFNPELQSCIAFFLNSEEFWTTGNGPNATGKLAFSPIVLPYIDKNHEWETEAGSPTGNAPDPYTVTCGIAFLSQTEWLQYSSLIGYADNMVDFGWYLRSGNPNDATQVLAVNVADGVVQGRSRGGQSYYLRPAFYLNKNFFKEVRLSFVGDNVLAALKRNYTAADLKGIYSNEELTNWGFDLSSINGIVKQADVNIYPNPVSVKSDIQLKVNETTDGAYLEVYDIVGRLIQRADITDHTTKLAAPSTPGAYVYHIHVKGKPVFTQKIIVK